MEIQEYRLESVCTVITDGSHYSPSPVKNGKPMLSVKDMAEYCFDYTSCKQISDDEFELMVKNGCVPKKGDVLVAKDGSFLKHIFVQKEDKAEAILSSIALFRPDQIVINSEFLCYYLKNPITNQFIKDNCVSGSAIPRIVLKDFKSLKISIPPLHTQEKIVSILGLIDNLIQCNSKLNDYLAA